MPGKRERENGTWEYVFKRKGVLPKPLYLTFDTEAEGDAYGARLEALLDQGYVPAEHREAVRVSTIDDLITEYLRDAHPSKKDREQLANVSKTKGSTVLANVNAGWVDDWVAELKRILKVAPATITAKVGAFARCCDWGMRKGFVTMPDHPLRTLPAGYAQYTKTDAALAGVARVDVERDRRLEHGEDDKVFAVLDKGVLHRKQRPLVLPYPAALRCIFVLGVESAMRMREMYTLTVDQVSFAKRTVFLDKTKNGDKRQVPLSTVAAAEIKEYLKVRVIPDEHPQDLLFPWWNGVDEEDDDGRELQATSNFLSKLWLSIFEQAGCDGLQFHDTRHEATSRLFERTQFSDAQIMKITGHKSIKMLLRYANLRGSNLAGGMW